MKKWTNNALCSIIGRHFNLFIYLSKFIFCTPRMKNSEQRIAAEKTQHHYGLVDMAFTITIPFQTGRHSQKQNSRFYYDRCISREIDRSLALSTDRKKNSQFISKKRTAEFCMNILHWIKCRCMNFDAFRLKGILMKKIMTRRSTLNAWILTFG